MKRTLAVTLSALALAASTSVLAQTKIQGPQPSFVDYPLVEANIPARADAGRNASRAVPQPSFVDYVAIESDSSTGSTTMADEPGAGRTMMSSGHQFPQPSFAN